MSVSAQSIKLVSFDLDDTLYDNKPVIAAAESACHDFLQQQFLQQSVSFDYAVFQQIRRRLLTSDDPKMENMSFFRQQALLEFCHTLDHKERIADEAFDVFIKARCDVSIPPAIVQMLRCLAKNFQLVSITNGNCDVAQLVIADYFSKNYSPVNGYRAKPHPQMVSTAIKDFDLEPQQVLHVGDSKSKDGLAAKRANTNFLLFSPFTEFGSLEREVKKLTQYLGVEMAT